MERYPQRAFFTFGNGRAREEHHRGIFEGLVCIQILAVDATRRPAYRLLRINVARGAKYVSEYNFSGATHVWIIQFMTGRASVSPLEEPRDIREGFSLLRSYIHAILIIASKRTPAYPTAIFLHQFFHILTFSSCASLIYVYSRSKEAYFSRIKINGAFSRISAHEARRHRRHFSHETPRTRGIP